MVFFGVFGDVIIVLCYFFVVCDVLCGEYIEGKFVFFCERYRLIIRFVRVRKSRRKVVFVYCFDEVDVLFMIIVWWMF